MAADSPDLAERGWIENRPSRLLVPRLDLRELWHYRDVGLILAVRDLKVRYKQTFFGVAWGIMQPLAAMALFTVILSHGAGLPSEGIPYPVFALVGLAVWFPFNTAVTSGAESLIRDPLLVTKVYFPRLLAPLGAVLAPMVDLAVSLTIAIVVALAAGVTVPVTVVVVPLVGLGTAVVAIAFVVWLAALNVLYRDVRYALGFTLQLLFFASPVVYPSSLVGASWQTVLAVNPLVGLIDTARWALLGTSLSGTVLAVSLASTCVMLTSGLVFFRWAERQFADRI
jgi:ABC-type polysaccharide/polyol phosphate export permease